MSPPFKVLRKFTPLRWVKQSCFFFQLRVHPNAETILHTNSVSATWPVPRCAVGYQPSFAHQFARGGRTFAVLLALFASLFLVGCSGVGGGPRSNFDKFAGVTINSTRGNDLPIGFLENFSIVLDMRQEVSAEPARTNYFFEVGSDSLYGRLVPAMGESLFVLADARRFTFSTQLRHFSGTLGNRYLYPADESQLRLIGLATNVEVRIVQMAGSSIEKKLSAKNRANFREFVEKFLPGEKRL